VSDSETSPISAWLGGLVVGLLVFGVLMLIGFLDFQLLMPIWGLAGTIIFAIRYVFGPWPLGEPTATYWFMFFMTLAFPPIWAGEMAFEFVADRNITQQTS
jgi:hypothetical protein